MAFMCGVFWLLEEHKKTASAKRKATKDAKNAKAQHEPAPADDAAPPARAPKLKKAAPVADNPNPTRPNGRRKQAAPAEPQAGTMVPYAQCEQAPTKEQASIYEQASFFK